MWWRLNSQTSNKRKTRVMQKLYWEVRRFFLREEGATMVEYGLMVALIAIVCLSAVTLLGTNVNAVFNQIAAAV